MKKIKHIKFISSLLSLVMLITSAGIAPIKSMAADSDNGEKSAVQLAWFRANGKSDGEFDGSCGSNWYNTGDASSDESKITGANGCEVQSGNAFGFIIGFDMSDFDSDTYLYEDVKITLTAANNGIPLSIWAYSGSEYHGESIVQKDVTQSVKEMLPSWNPDWKYAQSGTENANALASASRTDGKYTFNIDYDSLMQNVNDDNIVSLFVSSTDFASKSKTQVYLSGDNAPKMTYSYRVKPQAENIKISGPDKIGITSANQVQTAEYTAEVTDNYGEICNDEVTWNIISGEDKLEKYDVIDGKFTITTKNTVNDGDIIEIQAKVNDTVLTKKKITISQTYAKKVEVSGAESATVYTSVLPAVVGTYTAIVTDADNNEMKVGVTYSVDNDTSFDIDENGTLSVKQGVFAGEYNVAVTATVNSEECEEGTVVVSEPFEVAITVLDVIPTVELNPSNLLWFRANGKSGGELDGSCGNNWCYLGDSGLDGTKEIESKPGFGFITSFDISKLDNTENDLYDFKFSLKTDTSTEKLAIWMYDRESVPYYGSGVDRLAVTKSIKTMLPSWNTDWQYGGGTADTAPLATASVADGLYTFDFTYEQLKELADTDGMVSFFVTSEKLSSFDSKTKIYFSGKNAPKMTYSYRAKPQINGVTVVGADTIEFSGTKPLTDNKYIAKYKTQYEDVTYDLEGGMRKWSITSSDIDVKNNIMFDAATGAITVAENLPEGEYNVILNLNYKKNGETYLAEKNITIKKTETLNPTSVKISGKSDIELISASLPAEYTYNAEVLDQYGNPIKDEEFNWSITGTNIDNISINNGVLTIGKGTTGAIVNIKAELKSNSAIYSEYTVSITASEYASLLYPTDDVLFRKGNADTKNVNGAELEITNSVDNDRAFVGGLKFDISSLKQAIKEGLPITSIKLRLTASLSKDGKLMLKPLSNEWDESNSAANSYAEKADIITKAVSSTASIIDNEENKSFTLNRMMKDKYIYDGTRGETESIETWQTELDITDYLLGTGTESDLNKNGYIVDNKDEDYVSFLIMANYNGTNANKIFSKDVSEANYSDHWQQLIDKFPEIAESTDIIKPAIVIDYAKESVSITSNVSTLPVPLTDSPNSTKITAEHHNPIANTTDNEIEWSVVGFTSKNGEHVGNPTGISIDADGTLSVLKNAQSGTVTVRATSKKNNVIYTDFNVSIVKLASQLVNGSFENVTDAMMPVSWISYDPDIDGEYNGVRRYRMNQTSETQLSNITRTNDDDGLVSGSYSTDSLGNTGLMFKGAEGIDKDYEGFVYAHNANNSSLDGGPDIRVTSGITYWVSQDYRMENFYQLNDSAVVGPYMSYEGFQGTTSKKSKFSGTWYFKDGNPTTPYTTDGYDTLTNQITVPADVNRLRINWGLKASEGNIFYSNFRIAPQGIDTSKTAVDGENELKVTDKMTWTSDPIATVAGGEYTYKMSVMTDNLSSGLAVIVFKNSDGEIIDEEKIKQSKSLNWEMITGTVTVPKNTAYAELVLENGAKTGSVWYDDVIFTQSTNPVPTYLKINAQNSQVVSPLNGENRYFFSVDVTDQYNNPCDASVKWSIDYNGISVSDNGTLIVSSDAVAGEAVIKAEINGNVSDSMKIKVLKQSENSPAVTLQNGDFSEKDENNMPVAWTDSDKTLSIANSTFDTAISGWKLNYTTYSAADTSSLIEWDKNVDHTGNSGGSARIYNADRAQGSMQISDNIAVTGGQIYDLSVWVKTENISTDSNVYANILIYDKNGSTIEENKQLISLDPNDTDNKGNNTSDWTKLSGSMYINENAVKMRIDLRYRGGANNQNGTVWFDDLTVTKQAGIDSEKSYNGKSALMIKGYGFEKNDYSRTYGEKWDSDLITGITPGQEYYYSVNAQTQNASDGAYVMITYYNAAGKAIGVDKSNKSTNTEWDIINGASTAPEGAVSAVMSLCIYGDGTAWFANAQFETKSATEVKSLKIEGNDTVMASSDNYYYAVVTDQYGLNSDKMNILVTADTVPSGMQYDSKSGKLTVSNNVSGGAGLTLKASYNGLTATKNVKTLAETTSITISGSENVTIPSSAAKTVAYKVYNQLSQQIDSSAVSWTVSSNDVSIADGILTVPTGVSSKSITITAQYNGLKASVKVMLTTASLSQGNTGGGGGGGGGTWTGEKIQISATPAPNAMGNFDVNGNNDGTNGTVGTNTGTTIEELLPQPDPTYFTQGMDNVAGFTDIGSVKWAHKAIATLRSVNVINGKETTKFCPDDSITRAEFVQILIGMLSYAERIDTSDAECSFTDVENDAWYYNSVAAAVKYGIVSGISESEFAPNVLISRQDMCVMIDRACTAANITLPNGASIIFNDESNISGYALNAVRDMSKAGIVSGFEDGNFNPLENATRAQAAVIIYRMAGGAE